MGTAKKLYRQGRIPGNETTVLCITGNGLKTLDALTGEYQVPAAIQPRLADFEACLDELTSNIAGAIA